MKYIILFTIFLISLSCARKTNPIVEVKEEVTNLQLPADTVPQAIKNEIINLECNSANCDSLLQCYGPFFQFLYANLNPTVMYKALDCAVEKAVLGDYNAHRMIIEYYGSPFTEKKNNSPDWANRLRGEEAFEITLEYMRQSKGVTSNDIVFNRALKIYLEVVANMIIFMDNTKPWDFFSREEGKTSIKWKSMEHENWLTTEFIDILKKEIKEGRVVFKKYGE